MDFLCGQWLIPLERVKKLHAIRRSGGGGVREEEPGPGTYYDMIQKLRNIGGI